MTVTDPDPFTANIHDRMPVLLIQEGVGPWLREEFGPETLLLAPGGLLLARPVSRRVASSRAETKNATLMEAFDPPMQ